MSVESCIVNKLNSLSRQRGRLARAQKKKTTKKKKQYIRNICCLSIFNEVMTNTHLIEVFSACEKWILENKYFYSIRKLGKFTSGQSVRNWHLARYSLHAWYLSPKPTSHARGSPRITRSKKETVCRRILETDTYMHRQSSKCEILLSYMCIKVLVERQTRLPKKHSFAVFARNYHFRSSGEAHRSETPDTERIRKINSRSAIGRTGKKPVTKTVVPR